MTEMTELRPLHYDGFGFVKDSETGEVRYYFFDDLVKKHGVLPGPQDVPADRVAYHVLLQHVSKGKVRIERPFTSNFTDALAYAAHIAHAGFTGFMVRANEYSLPTAEVFIRQTIEAHRELFGFWADWMDGEGVDKFYPGRKQRKGESV